VPWKGEKGSAHRPTWRQRWSAIRDRALSLPAAPMIARIARYRRGRTARADDEVTGGEVMNAQCLNRLEQSPAPPRARALVRSN
jgi:hypothetical protein